MTIIIIMINRVIITITSTAIITTTNKIFTTEKHTHNKRPHHTAKTDGNMITVIHEKNISLYWFYISVWCSFMLTIFNLDDAYFPWIKQGKRQHLLPCHWASCATKDLPWWAVPDQCLQGSSQIIINWIVTVPVVPNHFPLSVPHHVWC